MADTKLPPFLATLFGKGTGNIIDSIGNVADKFFESKEEKEKFLQSAQSEINRHMEVMQAHTEQAAQMYLEDVANARAMQMTALNQQDKFSKRFIYFLAAGVIVLTMIYNFLFFFIEYPTKNHDVVNMVAGVLNTSCLVMIISFFFGSSKGSEDKQKQIMDMVGEK